MRLLTLNPDWEQGGNNDNGPLGPCGVEKVSTKEEWKSLLTDEFIHPKDKLEIGFELIRTNPEAGSAVLKKIADRAVQTAHDWGNDREIALWKGYRLDEEGATDYLSFRAYSNWAADTASSVGTHALYVGSGGDRRSPISIYSPGQPGRDLYSGMSKAIKYAACMHEWSCQVQDLLDVMN